MFCWFSDGSHQHQQYGGAANGGEAFDFQPSFPYNFPYSSLPYSQQRLPSSTPAHQQQQRYNQQPRHHNMQTTPSSSAPLPSPPEYNPYRIPYSVAQSGGSNRPLSDRDEHGGSSIQIDTIQANDSSAVPRLNLVEPDQQHLPKKRQNTEHSNILNSPADGKQHKCLLYHDYCLDSIIFQYHFIC